MKKPKVFISGPMSGYESYNTNMFFKCQQELIAAGFAVFNPAWLAFDESSWGKGEMMAIDICALSHCDAICMLPEADKSMGSLMERDFADRMKIPVLFYNPDSDIWRFTMSSYPDIKKIRTLITEYGGGIRYD